mmetsp:Transcript_20665/g.40004  ORF Transcript_20665/g.40004 Transcript_20665/m.40004 type:complete len:368 (+) Transcript_20665:1-1104(+)
MMYSFGALAIGGGGSGSSSGACSRNVPREDDILVLPEMVEREAKALHAKMVKDALVRSDAIISYHQLLREGFAEDDLSLILSTLKRKGLAFDIKVPRKKDEEDSQQQQQQQQHEEEQEEDEGRQLCIHFATPTWPKPVPADKYIAMFKLSEESLRGHVARWSHEYQQREVEAKMCVRSKASKAKCLSVLRRKKRAEKALRSAEKQLENVEIMRESLERVESDKALVGVFRKGSKYIENVINKEGLTPEAVGEVLDDVRDAVEAGNVLGDALAERVDNAEEDNYDELYAELEREVSAATPAKIERKNVPTTVQAPANATVATRVTPSATNAPTTRTSTTTTAAVPAITHPEPVAVTIENKKKKAVVMS